MNEGGEQTGGVMNRIRGKWQKIPVRWKNERWAPRIEFRPRASSRQECRVEVPVLRPRNGRANRASTYIVRCGNIYLRSEIRSTWR